MSIKVMSWVWENGPTTGMDRLVLLALADFCDDAGSCWPSMARIGEKACITERGARQIVRRLEAEGWVSTAAGGGRGGTNKYVLTMRNPEQQTGNDVPPEQQTGNTVHKTRNETAQNPEPPFRRTIKNHQEPYARGRARGFKSIGRKEGVNPFPAEFPYDHRLTFAENRKALDAWKAAQEQPA